MNDALEQQLRTLTPRAATVDRDRVMYEAGRREGRRAVGRFAWPAGAAAATSLIWLAAWLAMAPGPADPAPRPHTMQWAEQQTTTGDGEMLSERSYAAMRQRVLVEGVEALPAAAPPPPPLTLGKVGL